MMWKGQGKGHEEAREGEGEERTEDEETPRGGEATLEG